MKRKFGKIFGGIMAFVSLFSLASCGDETIEPVEVTKITSSDSLYVEKVENLSDDFIMGMDASSVISLENAGVKYYDYEGNEQDVFLTLAESGVNYIRVRIWNDPYDEDGNGYGGGNCDIDTAVAIGKRATKYGMKLLVNFHYSDFWADPAKQMAPKAWVGMDIHTKAAALKEYTIESLTKLKKAGVDVGMIQVGNETNAGKMAGEKRWDFTALLMQAGSEACRQIFPEALVALHFANPEKVTNYPDYAAKLKQYNVDYDVFASSYYPFWHGTLDNLATVLNGITATYGKQVMVAETSYCRTAVDTDFYGNTITDGGGVIKDYPFTIQGQATCVRNVIDTVANKMTDGIGVFYWEGTWISSGGSSYEENKILWEKYGTGWASSYASGYDPNDAGKYYGGCSVDNQAFFDEKGKAIESLKIFNLVKTGNTVELKPDAIADTTIVCDLADEIVLPTKVNAIMNDDSKQEIEVEWKYYQVTDEDYNTTVYDSVDFNAFKTGGPQKYDIVGIAGGMEAHCYLSMIEYNFLTNYSFESDANGTRVPTGWTVEEVGKADELHVEVKATDSLTGDGHYHFWSNATDSVEFYLEQEIKDLKSGKYKYYISIMGGDCGTTDIYAYVKIDGVIVKKDSLTIEGYQMWDTAKILDIDYNSSSTISVGIYVKCQGAGNGAWGKIDDALFNTYQG